MITNIFLFCGAIFGAHVVDDMPFCSKKTKRIIMLVLFVIVLLSACLMIKSFVVSDAEQVAIINTNSYGDTQGLFQENETDKYFITLINPWNPFEATCREYIDREVAEEYVAKYNELQELELP